MLFVKVQWRKVLRDLYSNKTRTLLVVTSIAVGIFAVSTVTRTWAIMSRELNENYLAIHPASIRLRLSPFDGAFVKRVQKLGTVAKAEGHTQLTARIRTGLDTWFDCHIDTLPDFETKSIDRLLPKGGALSPPEGTILIERSSLEFISAGLGDKILIETEAGKRVELQISGIVNDLTKNPTAYNLIAFGYINFDTLEELGYSRDFNNLRLIVSGNNQDEDVVMKVVEQVSDEAKKAGKVVYRREIPNPGKHPLDSILHSLLLILSAMAILAPFLSVFLTSNMISAIVAGQTRQIGIMKTIGARKWRIAMLYLTMVSIFGLLAWLIAIPLAALFSQTLARFLAGLVNFDITSYAVPRRVWALEIGASLIVPLLAALFPIVGSARATIREAISDFRATTAQLGSSVFDVLIAHLRGLNVSILYSLRNIFRRKARLGFTLVTLSTVSAIFITTVNTRLAVLRSINDAETYWQEDINLLLNRPYRFKQVERLLSQIPGVIYIEPQKSTSVYRLKQDGGESQRDIFLIGTSPTSQFIVPELIEGRWLVQNDENVMVANIDLLDQEPDLQVGGEISFKIMGRTTRWHVVGIVSSGVINNFMDGRLYPPVAYVNYPYLADLMRQPYVTDRFLIETIQHDPVSQDQIGRAATEQLENHSIRVQEYRTHSFKRAAMEATINSLLYLLLAMAVLFAVIGALGLTCMMSMNVLERTREFGVVRAIGAPGRMVKQIVIVEGIIIGLLSWILGVVIAIPLSMTLNYTLGIAFLKKPLDPTFSITGVLSWLVIVIVLSASASYLPARRASQITVSEALVYT